MRKFALVFPGQGAQSVGMVKELATAYPSVKAQFERACAAVGVDLWKLANEGPSEDLNQTRNTQPALLAASVAIWELLSARTAFVPALAAGHSFGEYSALVCAGALRFDDAAKLVATRGHLMQEAVPVGAGAMAAILGLDGVAVAAACAEAQTVGVVDCANLNAPGQVVIAGTAAAVARASEIAKAQGAKKVIPLSVSVPAHCGLMRDAADRFRIELERVNWATPRFPVLHNVDVAPHTGAAEIKAALVQQLAQPVRWQETIERFATEGITHVFECGPGKILGPLIKRCAPGLVTLPIATPAELDAAVVAAEGT